MYSSHGGRSQQSPVEGRRAMCPSSERSLMGRRNVKRVLLQWPLRCLLRPLVQIGIPVVAASKRLENGKAFSYKTIGLVAQRQNPSDCLFEVRHAMFLLRWHVHFFLFKRTMQWGTLHLAVLFSAQNLCWREPSESHVNAGLDIWLVNPVPCSCQS